MHPRTHTWTHTHTYTQKPPPFPAVETRPVRQLNQGLATGGTGGKRGRGKRKDEWLQRGRGCKGQAYRIMDDKSRECNKLINKNQKKSCIKSSFSKKK